MNWADNFTANPDLPATSSEERAQYERHFELLKEWNEKFNLVSRKSIQDAFSIHYADSLCLADAASAFFGDLPVIDLGSGAGFPGSVLAIRYPERPVLLLERSVKKQTFLQETKQKLSLANVQIADSFGPRSKTKAFVISRAVMAPKECLEYLSAFLAPGSRVAITVGGLAEFPEVQKGYRNLKNAEYTLPGEFGKRKISVFELVPRGT